MPAFRVPPPAPTLLPLLAIAAVAACLLLRRWPAVRATAVFAVAGFVLGQAAMAINQMDCRVRLPDGARVVVRGAFESLAVRGGSGPFRLEAVRWADPAGPAGPAESGAGSARCRGRVRARAPFAAPGSVSAGTEVVAWGRWWIYPPEGPWPRAPERAGRLALDSMHVLAPGTLGHHPMLTLRGGAQSRLRALFAGRSSERAGIAEALLLAQRGGLDPAIRERFARAGLTHLLAISGLHVGLIAATLLLVARVVRLSPRVTTLAAGFATLGYVLFLGMPHAASRAALQVLLVLAARLMQRPTHPFALLATAALVLLALEPLALLAPGFQLSFAGTAGLLALRARLLSALPTRHARVVREAVATSVAATLATAPIAALHFGRVAPIALVANLAAIPLVAAAVPALALALGMSFVSVPLGHFIAGAADLLLAGLEAVAAVAAATPGGHAYVPRDAVGAWVAAAAIAALIAGRLAGPRWASAARETPAGAALAAAYADGVAGAPGTSTATPPNRGIRPAVRRLIAAATAAALLVAWPALALRAGSGALEIHAIDVGQGDAFAIRTPAGRWMLVDAGPRTKEWDAGRARVVPFLLRHGVRRLDALLLTHPDADHIGGAAAVLEAFDVGAVIDPGVPTGKPLYLSLLQRALEQDVTWLAGRAGREIRLGDVVLTFLHPDGAMLDARTPANHFSVVFLLRYADFRALFLGDAPAAVERMLVDRYATRLRARVLKVAHHGSTTSTSEALLAGTAPEIALISAGRHNRYGHPAATVVQRLRRQGVRIYRTDRQGSITLRVDAVGGLQVETTR